MPASLTRQQEDSLFLLCNLTEPHALCAATINRSSTDLARPYSRASRSALGGRLVLDLRLLQVFGGISDRVVLLLFLSTSRSRAIDALLFRGRFAGIFG